MFTLSTRQTSLGQISSQITSWTIGLLKAPSFLFFCENNAWIPWFSCDKSMTRYPLKNKFKLIVLVTLAHSGPIEIGTYGAKCLLTNWKVFILFVYYVASLSSVALIHVFKMNGTSITKCFFNIIFDMKSFFSVLVISKSHDLVISLYRLINLCERYGSGILWSKSGRTALMWRDRSVLKHFAKNSHHLFEPSSLLDFFTGFSLFAWFTS